MFNILVFSKGGYFPDETFFLLTTDQNKYVVKFIKYRHSFAHLQSILTFQNELKHSFDYPCPRIILSKKGEILLSHNERFLFVQTFIQGIELTQEILDQDDHLYLLRMGRLLAK